MKSHPSSSPPVPVALLRSQTYFSVPLQASSTASDVRVGICPVDRSVCRDTQRGAPGCRTENKYPGGPFAACNVSTNCAEINDCVFDTGPSADELPVPASVTDCSCAGSSTSTAL